MFPRIYSYKQDRKRTNMNSEPDMKFTEFDYITGDHRLQMMKAALPYVEVPQQRILSILIKFQELRRTLALFESEDATAVGICSLDGSRPRSALDMLKAIQPYGTPQEQDFIDLIYNFLQGLRLGSQYQEMPAPAQNNAGPSLQQMRALLSPEQQSRLDTASLLMQAMQQVN